MLDTMNVTINRSQNSRISELDFENIKFGKLYSDHMFSSFYNGESWENAEILPFQPLTMSPANLTLHYGQSVFEGMKAYKNAEGEVLLFRPLENFKRMNISAKRMCLAEIPEELFMNGLLELLDLDRDWVPNLEGTALYIRPFIFATDEYIGIRPSDTFKFMIITSPAGIYYSNRVRVKIETHYSRAVEGGTGFAKASGNYGGSLYPAKLAQEQGYDQLIWTDAKEHKYIEESGTMNVMFLINDTLVTPPIGDTILNGITRDSVLTLARDWGMRVEERNLSVEELIEASENGILQEAFGVGTAVTIASIRQIGHNGKDYTLPEKNALAAKILKTLDGIKTGKLEDKFNWTMKV